MPLTALAGVRESHTGRALPHGAASVAYVVDLPAFNRDVAPLLAELE